MTKKIGIVIFTLGAVLLVLASLLYFQNKAESDKAGEEAERHLEEVISIIEENIQNEDAAAESEASQNPPAPMLDNYEYIGYMTVPALDLNLPVLSTWDEQRLKISPCRQFGSSETDDLVVAAHNYKRHFGYLGSLQTGQQVSFTDIKGNINDYVVSKIDRVLPEEVDKVKDSGYPFVMYTCNLDWSKRIVVYCSRK